MSNIRPGRSPRVAAFRAQLNRLRTWLYRVVRCPWLVYGGFVRLPWSVDLWSPNKHIVLGHHVQFGPQTKIHCDTEIGSYVLIAGNVSFVGRDDHTFNVPGKTIWDSPRGDTHKVVVEDDVWIGHGAIVLSGVTVGRGAVVSAGSLVVNDVPRYAVVGGNPARMLKWRFDDNDRDIHERALSVMATK